MHWSWQKISVDLNAIVLPSGKLSAVPRGFQVHPLLQLVAGENAQQIACQKTKRTLSVFNWQYSPPGRQAQVMQVPLLRDGHQSAHNHRNPQSMEGLPQELEGE